MSVWNDDKIELLKKYILEGLSYSQIADKLGFTRSGISGKVARLGIGQGKDSNKGKGGGRPRLTTEEKLQRSQERQRCAQKAAEAYRARFKAEATPKAQAPKAPRLPSPEASLSPRGPAEAPIKPRRERERLPSDFDIDGTVAEINKNYRRYKVPDIPPYDACKFITGDVHAGTAYYCGRATKEGSPWCPHHHKKVYVPLQPRNKNHVRKPHYR